MNRYEDEVEFYDYRSLLLHKLDHFRMICTKFGRNFKVELDELFDEVEVK